MAFGDGSVGPYLRHHGSVDEMRCNCNVGMSDEEFEATRHLRESNSANAKWWLRGSFLVRFWTAFLPLLGVALLIRWLA